MRACVATELPGVKAAFFDDAASMIEWLSENLGDVVLISLDHDLPVRKSNGATIDYGTGRQVADFLATLPPTCPVIVHTSNETFAPGMMFALKDANWPVSRVYPADDVAWIRQSWIKEIRRYVLDGWIPSTK
jgi:hypothetical protein